MALAAMPIATADAPSVCPTAGTCVEAEASSTGSCDSWDGRPERAATGVNTASRDQPVRWDLYVVSACTGADNRGYESTTRLLAAGATLDLGVARVSQTFLWLGYTGSTSYCATYLQGETGFRDLGCPAGPPPVVPLALT